MDSVDVTITDDDAPGVLITESQGSTRVTEPTNTLLVGSGVVTLTLDNVSLEIKAPSSGAPHGIASASDRIRVAADPNQSDFDTAYLVFLDDDPFDSKSDPAVEEGSLWGVTIDGQLFSYTADGDDRLSTVAAGLQQAIEDAAYGGTVRGGLTRFHGDFGTAIQNEVNTVHSSAFDAQDIDLASWNTNSNPDIYDSAAMALDIPQILPHTTIVGTSKPAHLRANVEAARQGPLPPDVAREAGRRVRLATTGLGSGEGTG